jgi:hypothetical protein
VASSVTGVVVDQGLGAVRDHAAGVVVHQLLDRPDDQRHLIRPARERVEICARQQSCEAMVHHPLCGFSSLSPRRHSTTLAASYIHSILDEEY